MAVSAKYVKALASGRVVVQRRAHVTGEVNIMLPVQVDAATGERTYPAPITISSDAPVDLIRQLGLSIEQIRNSNLKDLVSRFNLLDLVL